MEMVVSPEGLEIANCYLQLQDVSAVAETLGISVLTATLMLERKEVKTYINQVFYDVGYNNRFKMRAAMDALIQRKFQDMEEADTGSSKDITELLALSHKMSMDLLEKELQLEKIRTANHQTNIQINNDGTKYGALIEKLLGDKLV